MIGMVQRNHLIPAAFCSKNSQLSKDPLQSPKVPTLLLTWWSELPLAQNLAKKAAAFFSDDLHQLLLIFFHRPQHFQCLYHLRPHPMLARYRVEEPPVLNASKPSRRLSTESEDIDCSENMWKQMKALLAFWICGEMKQNRICQFSSSSVTDSKEWDHFTRLNWVWTDLAFWRSCAGIAEKSRLKESKFVYIVLILNHIEVELAARCDAKHLASSKALAVAASRPSNLWPYGPAHAQPPRAWIPKRSLSLGVFCQMR